MTINNFPSNANEKILFIVDFDDTIIDNFPIDYESFRYVTEKRNKQMLEASELRLLRENKKLAKDILIEIFANSQQNETIVQIVQEAFNERNELIKKSFFLNKANLRENVKEFLTAIKDKGHNLALATFRKNKQQITSFLANQEILDLFDEILCGDDFELTQDMALLKGKMYQQLLDKYCKSESQEVDYKNINYKEVNYKEKVVVIGDRRTDFISAKEIGLYSVAVDGTYSKKEDIQDLVDASADFKTLTASVLQQKISNSDSNSNSNIKMEGELISVIVRTYNNVSTIKDSINSILKQTYQNFEIIIVNDGSTDGTLEELQKITTEKSDKRIKVINQDNKGALESGYTGLHAATGKYITFLDADDVFLPEALQYLYSALIKSEEKVGFSYCDYYEINLRDNKQKLVSLTNIFNSLVCGIMFKRAVLDDVGFWDRDFLLPEYDLLIRVMKKYKGIHVAVPLFVYHRHPGSITADKDFIEKAKKQLFDKYGEIPDFKEY